MQKYNLAYIPKSKLKEFISIARPYQDLHHNYILGHNSIPHITISQFYFKEEHLEDLYKRIEIEQLDCNLNLSFRASSHISFDGDTHWISLLPESTERLQSIFSNTYGVKP